MQNRRENKVNRAVPAGVTGGTLGFETPKILNQIQQIVN